MDAASIQPSVVDFGQLAWLPGPVQEYFRSVPKNRQAVVTAVWLEQASQLDIGEGAAQWRTFPSTQRAVTYRPGFDLDARVACCLSCRFGCAMHMYGSVLMCTARSSVRRRSLRPRWSCRPVLASVVATALCHAVSTFAGEELMIARQTPSYWPTNCTALPS